MGAYGDRLEGELTGFTYQAPDGAFAVARVRLADRAEVTCVGPVGHVLEGQHVTLGGRWTDHQQFGRQFRIETVLVEDPRTLAGLRRYLGSGAVRGLGKTYAKRVVAHFGLETLRVLEEDPTRLLEVKGIGKGRLATITDHWERDKANRETLATLRGYAIGQALANTIIDKYGEDALAVVTREPYRLAAEVPRVGFRTADAIARDQGMSLDDPSRAEAALIYSLREADREGHCFVPQAELIRRARALEVPGEQATEALERLCGQGMLVRHTTADPSSSPIYQPRVERAEAFVAFRLRALVEGRPGGRRVQLAAIEEALDIDLDTDQRSAVELALAEGVTVITGGPGTGKTTIVRVLLTAGRQRGERWLLAAPTGRAARRLAETTGADGKTVHRLLEFNGRTARFDRGADNPLEADGVLVDEASMVDLRLMASLLAAIPNGCRLVLVGDADQLPSVGPGRVLGDVIASGSVPVATLTQVYRQAAGSGIVRNAHRINRGDDPLSGEQEDGARDFFLVDRDRAIEAQAALLEIVQNRLPRLGFDPLTDVQVLTPMHNGLLGTEALNQRLRELLNPEGETLTRGDRSFRVGDRVIQVRNDYDNDIFNGDVGRVATVGDGGMVVDFDGREVAIKADKLDEIEQAWCISIHKSQGSEYPAVVVAMHRSHRIMLRRNLLYTAITRAKRFCCVVGDAWAVRTAVAERGGDERWTMLAERLASGV